MSGKNVATIISFFGAGSKRYVRFPRGVAIFMFSTCPVVDTAQPNPFLGAVQLRYLPTLLPSVHVEAYGAADAKHLEQLSLEILDQGIHPGRL